MDFVWNLEDSSEYSKIFVEIPKIMVHISNILNLIDIGPNLRYWLKSQSL